MNISTTLKLTLTLLLTLVFTGCGENKLSPIPETGMILAFGDSLTDGVGVSRPDSYPAVLERLSGRRVVNAGISGEVTTDGLPRLEELLYQSSPDLLILLEGGNDILRNHNLAKTKSNLSTMITMAKKRGIQVILIGVPEKNLFSKTAPLYRELAEEHQLVFMDDLIASLLKSPKYKSDQLHFNKAGYQIMAERIHEVLIANGAL